MKSRTIFACAFVGLTVFYHTSVFAEDELYLCGIVQGVDTKNALVSVDVTSESCHGLQTFKLPAAKGTSSFNVDERKCFFIDSNQCKPGYVYNITKIERD